LSGAIVPIDPASIVVTGDATYTVTLLADGSVVVSGLAAGASVEFQTTGDVPFNAYSITNANGVLNTATPAPGDTFTSDAFAIGVFGFNSETQGNPINMEFDVLATDADGDTSTGTIDVTLVPADSGALTTLAATSESAGDTSSFSLLASDSQEQQVQKVAANSNTLTLATAVAAAGILSAPAAASDIDASGLSDTTIDSSYSPQIFSKVSVDDGSDGSATGGDAQSVEGVWSQDDVSDSNKSAVESSDNSLTGGSETASAEAGDSSAAADEGSAASQVVADAIAPDVGMPSAAALAAAGLNDNAQHGGSVEQVLADALSGAEGPSVQVLLDLLAPNAGLGGNAGDHSSASSVAQSVPAWDMAVQEAFVPGADMMFRMDVATLHPDAVQAVVNG
jgi:predicted Fe-Mo cluster-binding NifX family protein